MLVRVLVLAMGAEFEGEGEDMKWCGAYNCWCDEVRDIIDEPDCDLDCKGCDEMECVQTC